MPPALVPLALVAVGVPSALRAAWGRPRGLVAAWILSAAAVVLAQAAGEVLGVRSGVLGDAQVLLAMVAAVIASIAASIAERGR